MKWNPNGGSYNPAVVDAIARYLVTDAMVDEAIKQHWRQVVDTSEQRSRTRRSIAIGISCGSYPLPGAKEHEPIEVPPVEKLRVVVSLEKARQQMEQAPLPMQRRMRKVAGAAWNKH